MPITRYTITGQSHGFICCISEYNYSHVHISKLLLCCISWVPDCFQSDRVDLEKNAPSAPSDNCTHHNFMGRTWNFLWLGLLSKHRLALGGEAGAWREKSAGFLYKVLCRLPDGNELGSFSCGCYNGFSRYFCLFVISMVQLERL